MEEKILPILRFDNFNDYWQTSSLLSQVEVRRGLTYKPNDVRSNGARVLRSSNIVDDSFVILDDDVFVNKEVVNIPRISNGDILVTAANGSTKLVGKHAIIKNLPDDEIVVHGGFMLLFKTEQSYFVNAWMSSNEYKRVLQFVQGGNGAIGNLSSAILKSMKMSIPSPTEQSAIGSLFRTLDALLASYKDNLTNYQSLKETMLSKMFPKDGQTIPEIRLDGFEGEWIEKKLKDISKRVIRKNNNLVSERALTISAQFGLIDQEEFFQKKIASKDVSGYYLIKKGEFAYNKSYSTGYPLGAIKRLDKYENGVLSTLYILFKAVDVDSDYLAHYYESDKWHREVSMCAAEGARNHGLLNIAPADFFNTRLVMPKELDEQQAIGTYFSNLDNLIAAHQEKISQLETLKKKLLQDMFI